MDTPTYALGASRPPKPLFRAFERLSSAVGAPTPKSTLLYVDQAILWLMESEKRRIQVDLQDATPFICYAEHRGREA
ncbi:MAG: hypothetical protein QF473_35090 [Planctomycetota bacterium]|jgi:hypothetical protein|nr:hypothetical protein [Planctomycetota bacterium]